MTKLVEKGLGKKDIERLSAALRLFPTPFKGIYYVPMETERKGTSIDRPLTVLSRAIALFLESRNFYFSCSTAEEFLGARVSGIARRNKRHMETTRPNSRLKQTEKDSGATCTDYRTTVPSCAFPSMAFFRSSMLFQPTK